MHACRIPIEEYPPNPDQSTVGYITALQKQVCHSCSCVVCYMCAECMSVCQLNTLALDYVII